MVGCAAGKRSYRSNGQRPRLKRVLGAIGLVLLLLLLSACVTQRIVIDAPHYDMDFLRCVADGMDSRVYNDCLDQALIDWSVMSGY